jgi:putative endonuclease
MLAAVYILANKRNGTLYVGVSSNLVGRVWQHKRGDIEGFTKKYGVKMLVWYEVTDDIYAAITREKQIKKWDRGWKLELIEKMNPDWKDLSEDIGLTGFPLSRE